MPEGKACRCDSGGCAKDPDPTDRMAGDDSPDGVLSYAGFYMTIGKDAVRNTKDHPDEIHCW